MSGSVPRRGLHSTSMQSLSQCRSVAFSVRARGARFGGKHRKYWLARPPRRAFERAAPQARCELTNGRGERLVQRACRLCKRTVHHEHVPKILGRPVVDGHLNRAQSVPAFGGALRSQCASEAPRWDATRGAGATFGSLVLRESDAARLVVQRSASEDPPASRVTGSPPLPDQLRAASS